MTSSSSRRRGCAPGDARNANVCVGLDNRAHHWNGVAMYRDQPGMPIEINGGTLFVAIDALTVSLRIAGAGFKFDTKTREKAANELLSILNDTTYSVIKIDGEADS